MHMALTRTFKARAVAVFIMLGYVLFSTPLLAAVDFESDFESPTAMTEDGWIAAINYFTTDCSTYVSSPYAFPAPDNGPQVSALTAGATSQVVNIYSNYDDANQSSFCLETNVFQEINPITEADVGESRVVQMCRIQVAAAIRAGQHVELVRHGVDVESFFSGREAQ